MEPKKEIHILHATNPLSQEIFKQVATPPEIIKSAKNAAQTQCTTCFTSSHNLRTCERCKSVWYCSRPCQKKDWPRHKQWCTPTERPKGIKKLVETLVSNITIVVMLEVCAALGFDLVNDKKKEIGFKVPFMVRADIGIEPANIEYLVKLLLTAAPVTEPIQGMVQINRFHTHIPGRSGFAPLTPMRDNMWRTEREKANNRPDMRNDPLGLVEFVNNDSDFSITVPLRVDPRAMKLARTAEPFEMVSGITKKTFQKPMTVETCMEFINTHIRADKQNQLKLRAEMTDEDKAIIRGVQDKSVTRDAVVFLREKMRRESVFATLLPILDSPPATVPVVITSSQLPR